MLPFFSSFYIVGKFRKCGSSNYCTFAVLKLFALMCNFCIISFCRGNMGAQITFCHRWIYSCMCWEPCTVRLLYWWFGIISSIFFSWFVLPHWEHPRNGKKHLPSIFSHISCLSFGVIVSLLPLMNIDVMFLSGLLSCTTSYVMSMHLFTYNGSELININYSRKRWSSLPNSLRGLNKYFDWAAFKLLVNYLG